MNKIGAYLPDVTRTILGIIFVVFGLNGFIGFMSMPPMPEAANAFLGALAQSGYFMPFLKVIETACGIALLLNFFAPVALAVISPVILNILLFHIFLAPGTLLVPIVLVVCAVFLAWSYRDKYAAMFKPRTVPVQRQTRFRERPSAA